MPTDFKKSNEKKSYLETEIQKVDNLRNRERVTDVDKLYSMN